MTTKETAFLAYAAGFFDADGSLGVYWHKSKTARRGGQFSLQAKVQQKYWLSRFEEWRDRWGGSLSYSSGMWEWHLASQQAACFLKDILPYLSNKRDQAELAIQFQDRMKPGMDLTEGDHQYQQAVSDALREMKRTSSPGSSGTLLDRLKTGTKQLRFWAD